MVIVASLAVHPAVHRRLWRAAVPVLAGALLSACGSVEMRPVIERQDSSTSSASTPSARPAPPAVAQSPSAPPSTTSPSLPRPGGYYKDDGPGDNAPDPATLAAIPDPEPRVEPLHRFANRPYNVFGQDYVPEKAIAPFKQRGLGSWYGRKFHGQRTSSGERYDMYAMTAAHPTLPIPSYVQVTSVVNGRSVIVRINDRGPFHPGRIIDLSYTAAWKLGYVNAGSAMVELELITPDQIPVIASTRRPDIKTQLAADRARARTQAQEAANPQARAGAPDSAALTAMLAAPEPPQAVALAASPAMSSAPPALQSAPQPMPEAHAAPIPVDIEARGIFLQLGAFSGRATAENFRARIYRELNWLNHAISIHPREGMYRLHLGPYRDRSEAGDMAERIRAALELNPMIIVR
jgi:rare lipoprotein A